jgi:hypothetical protein
LPPLPSEEVVQLDLHPHIPRHNFGILQQAHF